MSSVKPNPLILALMIGGVLLGCSKQDPSASFEPLGDGAPEFASTAELGTPQGFMAGRWCVTDYSDPVFQKQLGLGALGEEAEVDKDWYYDFKSDGTFTCGDSGLGWSVTGKYAMNGNVVQLTYEEMQGHTIPDAEAEYKKKEESGRTSGIASAMVMESVFESFRRWTAIEVASDKKHLFWIGTGMAVPGAAPGAPPVGGKGLERMGEKKG